MGSVQISISTEAYQYIEPSKALQPRSSLPKTTTSCDSLASDVNNNEARKKYSH